MKGNRKSNVNNKLERQGEVIGYIRVSTDLQD